MVVAKASQAGIQRLSKTFMHKVEELERAAQICQITTQERLFQ